MIAFTNGSKGAFTWMEAELKGLLRRLLDVPDEVVRTDIPEHPEIGTSSAATTGSPRRSPTSGDGWRSPRAWRCSCAAGT